MSKSLVSIVIATKNEEKNIKRLLTSIQKQTYDRIETIIVDNNSSDKTTTIANKFTKKVYQKGPERSAQRNYGVSKAKGKYIVILDADMELTPKVITSCIESLINQSIKAIVIPEKTVGTSLLSRIRAFERKMYEGDSSIEVARFFEKNVFNEFGGYDEGLTGTEDYDLPYRISKKYNIGRASKYLYHHEDDLTLSKQLRKKYYYAGKSALYAKKHPELVKTQGNMLFRKAYIRNWKSFIANPFLGFAFILVRILETIAATLGYIHCVGFVEFVRTLMRLFSK